MDVDYEQKFKRGTNERIKKNKGIFFSRKKIKKME
jgi:hypothetical protein